MARSKAKKSTRDKGSMPTQAQPGKRRRQVDPGNYVQTNDPNGIVVITQLQPISVIFTLAGDQLPAVIRRMQSGGPLAATAFDRTGATRLAGGALATIDNQIDTATGMVKLRAVFDNSEQGLFPMEQETVEVSQPVAMTDQELESWEPQALIPEPVEQS